MLEAIINILIWIMDLTHHVTFTWALDILALTVIVRLLMFPLNRTMARSMKKVMQKLSPEMKEIQEKYKDKPDVAQKEVMELYKRYKVNPFAWLADPGSDAGVYRAVLDAERCAPLLKADRVFEGDAFRNGSDHSAFPGASVSRSSLENGRDRPLRAHAYSFPRRQISLSPDTLAGSPLYSHHNSPIASDAGTVAGGGIWSDEPDDVHASDVHNFRIHVPDRSADLFHNFECPGRCSSIGVSSERLPRRIPYWRLKRRIRKSLHRPTSRCNL